MTAVHRCCSLLPALALGLACQRPPPDCEYDSIERCLWEQGKAEPDSPSDGDGNGNGGGTGNGDGNPVDKTNWGALDRTLHDIVQFMGPGLEWALVDKRARELCALDEDDPQPAADGDEPEAEPSKRRRGGGAWSCTPETEIAVNGRRFDLEAGDGVVALTVPDSDSTESAALLEFALTRFDEWCADGSFETVDVKLHQEVHRCPLPEGPYLLVGRFPRDLEADRWQLSIAIMDAG